MGPWLQPADKCLVGHQKFKVVTKGVKWTLSDEIKKVVLLKQDRL